jgi:hypothetical protein
LFMIPASARHPDAVGASYRWTSRDAHRLARRVATDLTAMVPALR